ncbi:MAG: hypothetical protein ACOYD6_05610 [Limnochordia bacterium]|jgi:hypothetical protein
MASVNCPFCNTRHSLADHGQARCTCGARYFIEPSYDLDDETYIPGGDLGGREQVVSCMEDDGTTYEVVFY